MEEGDVVDVGDTLLLDGVVEGVVDDRLAADEVLLHDVRDALGGHLGVVGLVREDVDDGADGAGAHTASLDDGDLVGQTVLLQLLDERVAHPLTAGGHTAGAVADHAHVLVLAHLLQIGLLHGLQISDTADHAPAPPSFSHRSS